MCDLTVFTQVLSEFSFSDALSLCMVEYGGRSEAKKGEYMTVESMGFTPDEIIDKEMDRDTKIIVRCEEVDLRVDKDE